VANFDSHTLTVINTWRNEVTETLAAGRQPVQALFTPDGSQLAVANFGSNQIFFVETATRRVKEVIPVGHQPETLAWTPDGRGLLVAHAGSNDLAVIPLGSHTMAALIPTGRSPRGIAVVAVPGEPARRSARQSPARNSAPAVLESPRPQPDTRSVAGQP